MSTALTLVLPWNALSWQPLTMARPLQDSDEKSWLEAARGGDSDAFTQIVGRYQAEIFRYCARMLRNEAEGEEMAQETFVRAWQSLSGFRGDASLKNWLYKIATNLCLNQLSSWRRRQRDEADFDALVGGENPERDLLGAQQATRVRAAVTKLPPQQRAVVMLKIFEDLKFHEIATALGLSEGGVKAHFFVAMKNLRKQFDVSLPASTGVLS
jgi:RNA polymerase sigma-70 factor (ECF subfamily)